MRVSFGFGTLLGGLIPSRARYRVHHRWCTARKKATVCYLSSDIHTPPPMTASQPHPPSIQQRNAANLSSLESTGTILEEYVFDIRAGSPSKDDATTSNVLELLQSLRFLSQTFDEVDTTEPLVAFAKVYLEPDYAPKLQHANLFDDARQRGVSYYDKAPFQLRVGRVHTASGRVVMMGVCSSLDSLNAADEGKKNRSRVPDNLPMCSSEEPGMGPGGRTPIKRPAVGPSEATPRGPPHSSRRRGRLAALHFNSASD